MANHQITYFRTKDLGEASMLIVLGQRLVSLERNGHICWFVFDNKDECERLSHNYYYGEVLLNARSFHEAMSRLKGRIFSQS